MKNKSLIFVTIGLGLILATVWLLGLFGLGAPAVHAASYTVCPAGPPTCDYSVIQDAVDAAGDGDVIKIATGTYHDINNRYGHSQIAYIEKSIALQGGYTTAFSEPPDPPTLRHSTPRGWGGCSISQGVSIPRLRGCALLAAKQKNRVVQLE